MMLFSTIEQVDPPVGSGTIAMGIGTEGSPLASKAQRLSRIVVPPTRQPPVVFTVMLPATGAPTPGLNVFTGSLPVMTRFASMLPSAICA